ncbi:MAG: TPM domain-containing protein [Tenacibaculum sp.]|nr:TPM domain-containing protein [Tenacibaculum sp.]
MNIFKKNIFFVVLLLGVLNSLQAQFNIPEKPKIQTSVYDYVGLLPSHQKKALENKLIKYSDSTSTQIVIGIIPSTKGEYIGMLTPRWAHKWGIGQVKEDNGIFILLAKNDRKIWISPGYGVEHILTAGTTGDIIRNVIIPEFRTGNYYLGLNNGVDVIFNYLNGTYKAKPNENTEEFPFFVFIIIIIALMILLFIISKSGSNNRNNRGGGFGNKKRGDFVDFGGFSGGYYTGGTYSSEGFGGFGGFSGGFGGGGFSGGGAGGSW